MPTRDLASGPECRRFVGVGLQVTITQQRLPALHGNGLSPNEDLVRVAGHLQRVVRPDDDVAGFAGFNTARGIGDPKNLGRGQRNRPERLGPGQTIGDAIAGILILVINLIGGLAICMAQHVLDFSNAVP